MCKGVYCPSEVSPIASQLSHFIAFAPLPSTHIRTVALDHPILFVRMAVNSDFPGIAKVERVQIQCAPKVNVCISFHSRQGVGTGWKRLTIALMTDIK